MTSQRDKNREQMPTIAKVVDDLMKVFGPVKVVYAKEGKVKIDKRPQTLTTGVSHDRAHSLHTLTRQVRSR
jgi:hypothetical protein